MAQCLPLGPASHVGFPKDEPTSLQKIDSRSKTTFIQYYFPQRHLSTVSTISNPRFITLSKDISIAYFKEDALHGRLPHLPVIDIGVQPMITDHRLTFVGDTGSPASNEL
jgi:hypothetical protein